MNRDETKEKSHEDIEHEHAFNERISEYYHYAARRLAETIEKNGDLPTKFSIVKVLGSPNTRTSFLKSVVAPLLNPQAPLTLTQSLDELCIAAEKFNKFGIYSSVSIDIDEASQNESPTELDATIHLKERPRLWARTGTDFGNQEGSAYASANLRNAFGGAETLEANMSFGTRTKASYEVKFATPVFANPDTVLEVLGYGTTRRNTYASHDEVSQGCLARIKHLGLWGLHEVTFGGADRQVTNLHEGVSLAVRQAAGTSRKISLLHHFTRDLRDDPLLPTKGHRIRTSQELAGGIFGGSTSFVKLEAEGSKHWSLTNDSRTTLNIAAKSGVLLSDRPAILPDKFQLGGPQTVRGFMYNGLGPRSARDSLGGDVYLAWSTSLLTPIPRCPADWPIRFQAFINGGSLLDLHDKGDRTATLRALISQPSISAGFGLVFQHPIARIEMNFGMPIQARTSDRTRKGLSFGLGIDFM